MNPTTARTVLRLTVFSLVAVSIAGCNVLTRLSEVGDGPKLTTIVNPVARTDYRPVSLPMRRWATRAVKFSTAFSTEAPPLNRRAAGFFSSSSDFPPGVDLSGLW